MTFAMSQNVKKKALSVVALLCCPVSEDASLRSEFVGTESGEVRRVL
jgi:hypothetical protein